MKQHAEPHDPARAALAREMRLVESAVAMVAAGKAPRVQVGGLAFGDALLDHALRLGASAGVRVTPAWRLDESGLSLAFEPEPEREPGASPEAAPPGPKAAGGVDG